MAHYRSELTPSDKLLRPSSTSEAEWSAQVRCEQVIKPLDMLLWLCYKLSAPCNVHSGPPPITLYILIAGTGFVREVPANLVRAPGTVISASSSGLRTVANDGVNMFTQIPANAIQFTGTAFRSVTKRVTKTISLKKRILNSAYMSNTKERNGITVSTFDRVYSIHRRQ